ncbi:MAG: DUF1848 family protein [Spirochaetia bacterium]
MTRLLPVTVSRREDIVADAGRFNFFLDSAARGTINTRSFAGEHTVSLDPENTAGLSFWTKDPENLVSFFKSGRREILSGFCTGGKWRLELQVTVTGLGGTCLEPGVPDPEQVLTDLNNLVQQTPFPKENIIWRFDPVIITEDFPVSFWKTTFLNLAAGISAAGIESCIFSFMDSCASRGRPGILSRFRERGIPEPEEFPPPDSHPESLRTAEQYAGSRHRELLTFMADAAEDRGISLSCCHDTYDRDNPVLSGFSELKTIRRGSCTDAERYERIWGIPVSRAKFAGRSGGCGCTASRDAGRIDTDCPRCVYCYVTRK